MVTTHEPGATKIGMRLRALLLDTAHSGMSPHCEALLYAADRAEHVAKVIDPALERGAVVITDRYIDSSLAYQGAGRGIPTADIARLNSWATDGRTPDLTVLLDMPPEVGLQPARPLGRPARGRAARLPPPGPGRVPRAGPRGAGPLPGARRDRAGRGDHRADQGQDQGDPARPGAAAPPRRPPAHSPPSRAMPRTRPTTSSRTADERLRRARRPGGGRRAAAQRGRGRDDARLAVHRAARLRPVGRRAGLRGGAAVPLRRLRRVPVLPPGPRRDARRPAPRPPRRPLLRGEADQGPGAARGRRAVRRALAAWCCSRTPTGAPRPAANALLKAIEEPAPRTVWLLCAPSAEDLVTTIRSRCRVVTLRVPPSAAVAQVLRRAGRDRLRAGARRRAGRAGAHRPGPAARPRPGRRRAPRGGAPGAGAVRRRSARPWPRRPRWSKTAEDEAKAVTEQLDEPEREALRQAFGEGSTGKGVAKAMRGMAGAMKDLEDRQKSRATRVKRDTLDSALLELAAFYRDVLMIQVGAEVELANADRSMTCGGWRGARRRSRRCAASRRSCAAGNGSPSTSRRCSRSRS